MTETVHVDIVSDVVCPWCFVGKKRFEKALGEIGEDITVEVNWRPFQLDPTLPPEGKDRKKYLADKFGSMERSRELHQNLENIGASVGIPFEFEAIAVSPNTLDAHRLIRWAQSAGEGVQGRVVAALFETYFLKGKNIGDHAVLIEVAREAGMDAAVVESLLASDADREAITQEIALAQQMGVTGVPCFILENKYAVMGAQEPATIADAIRQVAAEKAAATV